MEKKWINEFLKCTRNIICMALLWRNDWKESKKRWNENRSFIGHPFLQSIPSLPPPSRGEHIWQRHWPKIQSFTAVLISGRQTACQTGGSNAPFLLDRQLGSPWGNGTPCLSIQGTSNGRSEMQIARIREISRGNGCTNFSTTLLFSSIGNLYYCFGRTFQRLNLR